MNHFADQFNAFMQQIMVKAQLANMKAYLPINKASLIMGFDLTDIDFKFTFSIEEDKVFYNRDDLFSADIFIQLDAFLFKEILLNKTSLFQAVVQNKIITKGNSQFLTFLVSKNLMLDTIIQSDMQKELEAVFANV